MELNTRNAKYTEAGTIECELEHPDLGWVPFHATPYDVEQHGRIIFEALKSVAEPYEPS